MLFIGTVASIVGLNIAAAKSREQLAIGLLFGLDIVFGLAVAPVIADRSTPWQASGATVGPAHRR